ncbi:hypothetical protein ATO6_20730 [Oceanicola sp. 22II-s10i]|uniref:VOC family protein n=1 Tax=Oceanicola sp. 22II-s10i TaxID=1317116 RepID=UPI000B657739|nr:VOC family protein [Oceanicola sp. 22II-s10i]OWU83051.1 hypothetical protein ATO6_20730 [Oceanicola sp. 22II-s10i]
MSRIFGPVRQLGFVVHDMEAAMHHWSRTLGIGPFFYFPTVVMDDFQHRGTPQQIELGIALANDGEMQIELIQQTNSAPSAYLEHIAAHGQAMHHTSAWTTDFDGDMARILEAGHTVLQSGRIGDNRFAYFETQGDYPSTTMELYDVTGRPTRLNDKVRDAARDWDGGDHVVRFG